MTYKAVIFDYVGTLVNCRGYSMDASKLKLYQALVAEGFTMEEGKFLAAYSAAHEKYRRVRYEQLREVTNAVWVSDALRNSGFEVSEHDPRLKAALNVFFQDFIDTLELREGAKKLVQQAGRHCKVGLISNFTYAPVIYASLWRLGIGGLFSVVVVSEEVGWRKPDTRIFEAALSKLQVPAEATVYVGDSPIEDIGGAKAAGLKTVFVPSQFNSLKDLQASQQRPDYEAKDLKEVFKGLSSLFEQC